MKIKFPNLEYNKILNHFTIGLNIFFLSIVLMNYLGWVAGSWSSLISYAFYFVVAINTLFFSLKINNIPEDKREESGMIYYFSHFFLLTLIIITINQFLKKEIITSFMPELTAISIALGFLTFYAYRNKVEKEIEKEKVNEEKAEKRRKEEFQIIHPKMNSIPILKHLLRWIYKEGWKFSIPFVGIVALFIAIKIGMPLIFNGSYIDEYYHIFSGIEFFKTGHFAEIYRGSYYMRGAYVSFLTGLFMFLFGQTIFVAKMVPATIGIINFSLLYLIARKLIRKKSFVIILMLIYTINPWVIFNHFYIRGYVFYELFFLSITFSLLKLVDSLKKGDKIKIIFYSGILVLINLINYFLSNDSGRYLILFLSGIYFLHLYLFEIKLNKKIKLFLFLVGGIIILLLFDIKGRLNFLLNASFQIIGNGHMGYLTFFFDLNVIASILFLIMILLSLKCLKKGTNNFQFIFLTAIFLFIIHLTSSYDLQIIRGILYFIPLFYLIILSGFAKLNKNHFLFGIISLILIIEVIMSFPVGFLDNPYIPSEVQFIDNNIYYDSAMLCQNKIIITSGRPEVALFFNITPNFYFNSHYPNHETNNLIQNINESLVYHYTNTKLLNTKEFEKIVDSNKGICFIHGGGLPTAWVDSKSNNILLEKFNLKKEGYRSTSDSFQSRLYIKE